MSLSAVQAANNSSASHHYASWATSPEEDFTYRNQKPTTTTKGNHNKMNAVLTTPQTAGITLYYREGSTDKVYHAAIEPQGEGFVVNIAYGRRGSTRSTGTKTQIPVNYDTRSEERRVGKECR